MRYHFTRAPLKTALAAIYLFLFGTFALSDTAISEDNNLFVGNTNEASGTQQVETQETESTDDSIYTFKEGLTLTETILVDNQLRESLVYLPCNFNSEDDYKRPLVIVLHGARLTGKIAKAVTKFDELACKKNFLVAYPDALNKQWNDGRGYGFTPSYFVNDDKFILRLAKILQEKYNTNPKKVYLVGYSSGGMLAQKIAMQSAEKIAGIGIVAATMPTMQYNLQLKPNQPMPVVMINGTHDHAFPWRGGNTSILGVKVGSVIPVKTMLQYWLSANGGIKEEQPLDNEIMNEGEEIEVKNYITNKNTQVTLFKINGGGHTWPGGSVPFTYIPFLGKQVKSLNAAEVIWNTLSAYQRN